MRSSFFALAVEISLGMMAQREIEGNTPGHAEQFEQGISLPEDNDGKA